MCMYDVRIYHLYKKPFPLVGLNQIKHRAVKTMDRGLMPILLPSLIYIQTTKKQSLGLDNDGTAVEKRGIRFLLFGIE